MYNISGVKRCLELGGLIVIHKRHRWLTNIHDITFYVFCVVLIVLEQIAYLELLR